MLLDTSKKINVVNTYRRVNKTYNNDYTHLVKNDPIILLRQPRHEPIPLSPTENLAASILVLNVFGILPATKNGKNRHRKASPSKD